MPIQIQSAILVDDSEDEEVRTITPSHRQSQEYVLSRALSFHPHNDLALLPSEPLFCMFCNDDINKSSPEDRQRHYDEHLSSLDTLRGHELSSFQPLSAYTPNVNSTPYRSPTSTEPTITSEKVTEERHLFKS